MSIENKVNDVLNKAPAIKKIVKRIYQLAIYSISPKIKKEGNIYKISPNDGKEYFFGYYDKSPWDITNRYMLSLRVERTDKETAPRDPADIVIFDTFNNNEMTVIAQTNSWNVQQGAMVQWLGPDFSSKIIYNDFRDNEYCSVVLDLESKEELVLSKPVYSVSNDGNVALSLDFSRLHTLRKGYGYSNKVDTTKNQLIPDSTAIWKININNGDVESLLKYKDFADFEPKDTMKKARHKVNHIMINPDGTRFMVLHRWLEGSKKYTRLVTVNIDGSEMYNLSDENMVSHCYWKNKNEILAFAHKNTSGNGYYLMKDKTQKFEHLWPDIESDGHPSYSPDRSLVVTDTYPDKARTAKVYLLTENEVDTIAKVHAPFKYDNDLRCDLHPRWNRSGNQICIDSVYEGKRGLYVIKI